jgi:hypothetical protein
MQESIIESIIEIDKGSSTMSIFKKNTILIVDTIDRGRSTLHEIEIETGNIININVMLRPSRHVSHLA